MQKQETERQAVPVMKQLARPMSKEELATVAGAGCSYQEDSASYMSHDSPDEAN